MKAKKNQGRIKSTVDLCDPRCHWGIDVLEANRLNQTRMNVDGAKNFFEEVFAWASIILLCTSASVAAIFAMFTVAFLTFGYLRIWLEWLGNQLNIGAF